MANLTHSIEGNELVIRVKIDTDAVRNAPPSSTGKSLIVGSVDDRFTNLGVVVDGLVLSLQARVIATKPRR